MTGLFQGVSGKQDSALVFPWKDPELQENLWRSFCPTPLLKLGCLGPDAHDHAQDTERSPEALSVNPELYPKLPFDFNRVQNIGIT